jgi:hypothetical protein
MISGDEILIYLLTISFFALIDSLRTAGNPM